MATRTFKPSRQIIPISDNIRAKYKIEPTNQRPKFVRLLLSGDGGQGKTSIIGTASKRTKINDEWTSSHCNVLLIEYDPDGDDTIVSMGAEVDRIQTPTENQLLDILKACSTSEEFNQYDVIAIDAYNRLYDIEIDTSMKTGQTLAKYTRTDLEIPEIQDYNRLYKRGRMINDYIHAIKKHIIVTCIISLKDKPLDMWKEKKDRDQIISLLLDGKMAHLLSTQFSLHGIVTKEGQGKNIHVRTSFSQYNSEAKTRFRMEHTPLDVTFPKILEMIGIQDPSFNKIHWKQDSNGFLSHLGNIQECTECK